MLTNGFPAEILLLFTILVWCLYSLIYLSSPKNKVNQWAGICGFLLSIGVLKEYLYYAGLFEGTRVTLFGVGYELDELMNSILTAVLYYLAMPCVMIFSFYFCHIDKKYPKLFKALAVIVFIPVLCFGIVYPWSNTRQIPVTNPSAFVFVSVYNLVYGLLVTVPILFTLVKERRSAFFRQRRLVSVIALLPLWYWLITLFLFHLLKLESLYKLWQGNAVILLVLFVYYVRHLLHEGIWGLRLNREYFDWSGEYPVANDNIKYIVHMLKNELAKIGECSRIIREQEFSQGLEELDIIDRSVRHIGDFVQKSRRYSRDITLTVTEVNIKELFHTVAEETRLKWNGNIEIRVPEGLPPVQCDHSHMKETLTNLAENSIDSMGKSGTLTFSCKMPRRSIVLLCVKDTGKGISRENLNRIFEPYYTGYSDSRHTGLGLSYCQNVIKAHKGYISVKSTAEKENHGTAVTLCLPQEKRKKRSAGTLWAVRDKDTEKQEMQKKNGKEDQSTDRRG